jgi:hypothetical protein
MFAGCITSELGNIFSSGSRLEDQLLSVSSPVYDAPTQVENVLCWVSTSPPKPMSVLHAKIICCPLWVFGISSA